MTKWAFVQDYLCTKFIVLPNDSCHDEKKLKNRLTVLFFTPAMDDKLRPILISKSKLMKVLKRSNMGRTAVRYRHQSSALSYLSPTGTPHPVGLCRREPSTRTSTVFLYRY